MSILNEPIDVDVKCKIRVHLKMYTDKVFFIQYYRTDYVSELEKVKTIHFNSTLALHR